MKIIKFAKSQLKTYLFIKAIDALVEPAILLSTTYWLRWNKLCPCGSGKKQKKCCGNKF